MTRVTRAVQRGFGKCTLILLAGIWGGSEPAAAQDVTLINDTAGGGGNVALAPGFAAGEIAASTFDPPSNIVQFPVRIKQIQIFWQSYLGGSPDSLEQAIHVYQGRPNTPQFQEICIDPSGCALDGPVLSDGFLNAFNIYPAFNVTIPNGPFTVGLEMANTQSTLSPTVGLDQSTCNPPANWIFCIGGGCSGWTNWCSLYSQGNFVIRVVVQSLAPPSPPTVTQVAPSTQNNDAVVNLTITGTNFVAGSTSIRFDSASTNFHIDATGVSVTNANTCTCSVDLRCVPTGAYSCTATTGAGAGPAKSNALTVNQSSDPPPSVAGGSLASTNNCPGTFQVTVFGSDFLPGASAALVNGASTVNATTTTFTDAFTLDATFGATQLAPGNWVLQVTNPDCQSRQNLPGDYVLSVSGCAPTVTSITPNTSNNQQSALSITNLAGTNLLPGATVKLIKSGQPDIIGSSVASTNGNTKITCTFNLYLVQSGTWNVKVVNPGAVESNTNVTFAVTLGPAPTVSLVTPGSPPNCGTFNATINGSGFLSGATALLRLSGQPDIVGSNVVFTNSTRLTASFNLSGAATTPGADKWDCIVTNPDTQIGTGVDKVNVTASTTLKGDMNGDGVRNGDDIKLFVSVLLTGSGTSAQICAADMAAPFGTINGVDAAAMVNCLLGNGCPP